MIYVKDCLLYKRQAELESRNIESIWIELTNNHKRVLFGLFYRPQILILTIFLALKIL